jgi:uncharacterized membrane protein YfcA
MLTDPLFYLVGIPTTFLMSLGKGAFGGGLAMIGTPLLALVVDPVAAAIMVAPLVSASDIFGLRAFPAHTWSWPDLTWLAPSMAVGVLIGVVFFVSVDPRVIGLGIALVTLVFTARWFLRERRMQRPPAPISPAKALACGTLAGFTTFVAHSGSLPLALYLLPRQLSKTVYAGTTVALFLLTNTLKLIPYLWLGWQRPDAMWQTLVLLPAVPIGVWVGKVLHDRLDQHRLYFYCYLLVGAAGLKLLFDSVVKLLA